MRPLAKLILVELKLFLREPITVFFTLALPFMFLFVMGEVFGNTPNPEGFRGVGAMDYYVPAYIGLVIASIGLPQHLTSYRERGVLRRFRASSLPVWSVFASQVLISFVIALLGSVLLTIAALLAYEVHLPKSFALLMAAFAVSSVSFAALGVFLGAVLPTARAAQGVGLLLFFMMMFVGGAAPPPEVMPLSMQRLGDVTPLKHVIILLQDAWFGSGWNGVESLVVAGFMVAAAAATVRVLRWGE